MKKELALLLALTMTLTDFTIPAAMESFAQEEITETQETKVIPGKAAFTKKETDETSVSLSWKAVSGAEGYALKIYNNGTGQWDLIKNQSENTCKIISLKPGRIYRFSVTAFVKDKNSGNNVMGKMSEIKAVTKPQAIKSVKISDKKTDGYTISWKKTSDNAYYYIYRYSNEKKKFVLVKKTRNNSIKIKGRKPGQKNTYIIKSAQKFNGKMYFSREFRQKISSLPAKVKKLDVSVKKGTANLSWSKVTGASGYQIYYKPVGEKKYILLKDIKSGKKTSYTTNALANKKVYIKIRAYVKADEKNYYGQFSKSVRRRFFKNISYNKILKNYRNSFDLTTSNAQGYKMSAGAKNALLNEITRLGGTESFALLDLDSGAMVGYNAKSYIETASTVKMPFMLYSLKQMDKGKATLNTKVSYTPEDYNGGTGEVKNNPYGTKFTLRDIFHKVCYLSDNSAYYILQRTFGIDGYNKFISSLGCRTSVSRYGNRWGCVSAVDSTKEWIQMYDYFKNGKYGKFIRNELANSGFSNFRIGLYGRKCRVYSKCGFTENLHHDTSVVETKHPYVLVCLTTTVSAERLQAVARAADNLHNEMWRYFDSQK